MSLAGRAVFLFLVAALLGGCAARSLSVAETLERSGAELKILLMPLDVELSEISAGGMALPKDDWTAQAERHIARVLAEQMGRRRAKLVAYAPPRDDPKKSALRIQLIKLHEAVGLSIIRHKMMELWKLPGKADKFDWSLGPGVRELGREFEADYAMFVFVRDSYASPGRTATMVIAAAMGAVLPGGRQLGFASLVDLRSGGISWFNLLARQEGDLRSLAAARKSVAALLRNFPK